MKKLFTILVMLAAMNASGQWVKQYDAGNTIFYAIQFSSNNTGYIVGESNDTSKVTLLKTTNGGINWFYLILDNNNKPRLFGLSFINDLTGYVCGSWNKVFKTTDGGLNWTFSEAPIFGEIYYTSIQFLNEQTGYIGGRYGMRAKTTNSGLNWITYDTANTRIYAIHFFDVNTGIMADAFSGIHRTINGGLNWTYKYIPDSSSTACAFYGISFIDDNTGYVSGTRYLLKTTNKGIDWSIIKYFDVYIRAMFATSDNKIYVGGESKNILYSSNSGSSWSNQPLPITYENITSIYFLNNNTGFCCGYNGKIYKTTNGGVGVENISKEIPSVYSLSQNYPNPFNPVTKIKFDIPRWRGEGGWTTLRVYDITGREVQTLVNERLQPGTYKASFDGSTLNSGVYFYKLITDGFTETKKMLLIK